MEFANLFWPASLQKAFQVGFFLVRMSSPVVPVAGSYPSCLLDSRYGLTKLISVQIAHFLVKITLYTLFLKS